MDYIDQYYDFLKSRGEGPQCQAATDKGTRCKNPAALLRKYCLKSHADPKSNAKLKPGARHFTGATASNYSRGYTHAPKYTLEEYTAILERNYERNDPDYESPKSSPAKSPGAARTRVYIRKTKSPQGFPKQSSSPKKGSKSPKASTKRSRSSPKTSPSRWGSF